MEDSSERGDAKKGARSTQASPRKRQDSIQDDVTETDPLAKSRKQGGQACFEKYGNDHYRGMGQKGGNTTKQRHDAEYYRRIGALGREARRKKKLECQAYSFSPTSTALDEKERSDEKSVLE